jgi:hypothetical protein
MEDGNAAEKVEVNSNEETIPEHYLAGLDGSGGGAQAYDQPRLTAGFANLAQTINEAQSLSPND